MSNPYAPPGESAAGLWMERSNFSGGLLAGVFYGIHASVFAATAYFMIKVPKSGKISWPFLLFAFVLFACGTVLLAGITLFDQRMWIDDRNFPGGPNGFQVQDFSNSANVFGNSAYVLANFLADGVLLFRLLVVWNYNYFVVVIPFLAFLASTVLSVLTIFQSSQPGNSLWTRLAIAFGVPYFSLSVALNVLLTLAIAFRLLMMRRSVQSSLGPEHATLYTSISSMMIESAALYSITGLVYIVAYALGSNVQNLALPVLGQVMCIAPELIILRVAMGRAWTRDTSALIFSTIHARQQTGMTTTNGVTVSSYQTYTSGHSGTLDGDIHSDKYKSIEDINVKPELLAFEPTTSTSMTV